MSDNFASIYSKLNSEQKLAVDTIEGPVVVLAGPGTGKTQVLTLRIANILQSTDTSANSILALTFTEAAAREMKDRLTRIIGQDAYYLKICTFHAFCADVINSHPDRFARIKGMENITDLEKVQIITQILDSGKFTLLKPLNAPNLYIRDIQSAISDLKREGITLDKFTELTNIMQAEFVLQRSDLSKTALIDRQKQIDKNLDLLQIYQKYEEALSSSGRFDFDDMINWVVREFESDSDFLLSYQEQFQYILVDEYQDTNSSQNRLLFALCSFWGEQANLFVVGDPNQSIYRFQGASKENLLDFAVHFPHHTQVELIQNYRSTATILRSSGSLISELPLHANTTLTDISLKTAKFDTALFEDDFIASTVKSKIDKGQAPETIAVIVKENKDLEPLINLFKLKNIPYKLEGGANILQNPLISQFLKLLNFIVSLPAVTDDLELFTLLNYPYFKLDPVIVLQTAKFASHYRVSLTSLLINPEQINNLKKDQEPLYQDFTLHQVITSTFAQFISWQSQSQTCSLTEIFQIIFQESGFLNHVLSQPQPLLELNRFNTLFTESRRQATINPQINLVEFVRNINLMIDNNLKLEEKLLVGDGSAVTLTTAHKSKGLEWQTVFIYRFADTHWGNKTKRQMIKLPDGIVKYDKGDKDGQNEEERRLFYVAMTRAKQELYLTGAVNYDSAKMTYPSMFLSSLPVSDIKRLKTKKYQKRGLKLLTSLLVPTPPTVHGGEKDYLASLIGSLKLSPTSLNTYLECHYKFKLDNLYRIPRAKAPSMCFGTAVHVSLEHLYKSLNQTGKLIPKSEFIVVFNQALQKEILAETELSDRLTHGQKVLSLFYDRYESEFKKCLFTEKSFGTSLGSPIYLDDIPLTGKADRIDLLDETNKSVLFVDYKTGSPKSRSQLEKDGDGPEGNYKRQLAFYHLLADLDKSFPYTVTETELLFVEPDATGQFHAEKFNIAKPDIDHLKSQIKRVYADIKDHNFDRTTDVSICARCDFRSHCYPSGLPVKNAE